MVNRDISCSFFRYKFLDRSYFGLIKLKALRKSQQILFLNLMKSYRRMWHLWLGNLYLIKNKHEEQTCNSKTVHTHFHIWALNSRLSKKTLILFPSGIQNTLETSDLVSILFPALLLFSTFLQTMLPGRHVFHPLK